MYEMWHILTAYFVGTTAGVILFKTYVKEQIIVATLDNLVEQGFVKSFLDDEGTIQFVRIEDIEKYNHLTDLIEEYSIEIEELLDGEEENEDDTP